MTTPLADAAARALDLLRPDALLQGLGASVQGSHAVIDPARDAAVFDAPLAGPGLIDAAVGRAAAARQGWAADPAARAAALVAMADAMAGARSALSHLLALETGLPLAVATDEISAGEFFLRRRAAYVAPVDTLVDDGRQRIEVARRPAGVVAAILPWNAPIMIACEKIGSAFAAGNTVVVKTSPLAPLAVLYLAQLVQPLLPDGVLQVLNGDDAAGQALVEHPGVGMVSFTGSIRAGRAIMAAAAPTLKRLSLELGGNDAAIVLADADLRKTAAKLFFGAFYRTGQVCAAIKRLYVPRVQYDSWIEALGVLARQAVLGGQFDPETTLGPISNRAQFERVQAMVAAAVAAGGVIASGGKALDRAGFFFEPTIVRDAAADNPLVADEQFGPALPVIAYDDVDEAVAAANGTQFGLGGSIWTEDVERGLALARRLEAGSAWVNRHGLVQPDVPFGGMKQSGIGRANGQAGLDAYSELQTLSVALPRKAG